MYNNVHVCTLFDHYLMFYFPLHFYLFHRLGYKVLTDRKLPTYLRIVAARLILSPRANYSSLLFFGALPSFFLEKFYVIGFLTLPLWWTLQKTKL